MTLEHELLTKYLDGELEYDRLHRDQQREADAFLGLFRSLQGERVSLPPSVRASVMARVHRASESPWRRGWVWVLTPRAVRLSPITGALALAAVVALIVLAGSRLRQAPRVTAEVTAASTVMTRFVFVAPAASQVAVTGDFVSWNPAGVPLDNPGGAGVWTIEIPLLPGIHHYVFIVDGTEWRPDPNGSQVDDGFGQKNNVLLVPHRAAS